MFLGERGLSGRVAIVTGGGTGIGRETCRLLANQGVRVVVAGLPAQSCEQVASEIIAGGGAAIAAIGDVTVATEAAAIVHRAMDQWGRLDIAFNNAGATHDSLIGETSEETWTHVVDVTLKGVFLCCKYEIPAMVASGGGTIINSGSTAGIVGFARRSAYCAAKGGVIALSRALAVECAPDGIRVNVVAPGATDTPMVRDLYQLANDPEEARLHHLAVQPLGRLSQPADIAQAVVYLACADTATGTCLVVDGGYSAR